MPLFVPPQDYHRIKIVSSFDELVSTPFRNGINALCWQRELSGDFDEVVSLLGSIEEITTLDVEDFSSLRASPAGTIAIKTLVNDQMLLEDHGLAPILDCIPSYSRDTSAEVMPTDVYSFHVDSATIEADTYLCSYNQAATEILRNDEAMLRIDNPETRARLLKHYDGQDDEGFREFLHDHCFDLHYEPLQGARPFCLGVGNMWRLAVEYPGSPVPPCIHRAPDPVIGRPPRLLLIS